MANITTRDSSFVVVRGGDVEDDFTVETKRLMQILKLSHDQSLVDVLPVPWLVEVRAEAKVRGVADEPLVDGRLNLNRAI